MVFPRMQIFFMINQHSAGIILYFLFKERKPFFLLLHHGGKYWNFPKGKSEPRESPLKTAFREVLEETGIPSSQITLHQDFQKSYVYHFRVEKGRMIHKKVIFFLGCVKTRKVLLSDEHVDFGWFEPEEALKLLSFKNSQQLLLQAMQYLKSNFYLQ